MAGIFDNGIFDSGIYDTSMWFPLLPPVPVVWRPPPAPGEEEWVGINPNQDPRWE